LKEEWQANVHYNKLLLVRETAHYCSFICCMYLTEYYDLPSSIVHISRFIIRINLRSNFVVFPLPCCDFSQTFFLFIVSRI